MDEIPLKAVDFNILISTWNIRHFGDLTQKWISRPKDSPKSLSKIPRTDNKLFSELFSEYRYDEIKTHSHSKSNLSLNEARLYYGFAINAVRNEINLTRLIGNSEIIHEWMVGSGKELFEKFKRKFKDNYLLNRNSINFIIRSYSITKKFFLGLIGLIQA